MSMKPEDRRARCITTHEGRYVNLDDVKNASKTTALCKTRLPCSWSRMNARTVCSKVSAKSSATSFGAWSAMKPERNANNETHR